MVLTSVSHWGLYFYLHFVLILYQAQVSFLSQDNIDACVNQIRIDFVRLCTDFDFHILVGPLSCQSTPSSLLCRVVTELEEH